MVSLPEEALICFEKVTFAYGKDPVLEDISFEIQVGDSACIIGPNGGGKTTMIKLILGQLIPQSGTIRIMGKAPKYSALQVGYVPQHFQFDPSFPMTVLDFVLMGRLGRTGWGRYTRLDRESAEKAMYEMDVQNLATFRMSNISGGQRQRVLIARALAGDPEILLMDEPTSHVDAAMETRFRELLSRLHLQMSILTVSHDHGFVSSMVKRVICVNRMVVLHDTESLTNEAFQKLYGGELRWVNHDHCPGGDAHVH